MSYPCLRYIHKYLNLYLCSNLVIPKILIKQNDYLFSTTLLELLHLTYCFIKYYPL
jgi:hypothetical protein